MPQAESARAAPPDAAAARIAPENASVEPAAVVAADKSQATPVVQAGSPREIGGPSGPDPVRFGDWERGGRCIDF